MKRFRDVALQVQTFWSITGITLLILFVGDAFLRGFFKRREASRNAAIFDRYPGGRPSWAAGYVADVQHDVFRWSSYLYWRRSPIHGRYVQVSEAGLRRTWNAPGAELAGAQRVFVFGGSTVWGTDVRDDYTVPSCLSRELSGGGLRVQVTNYGESGYVATQGMVSLMLELRRGNIPDVVVFYDGINDVAASYQNGRAGLPSNEAHRVEDFNADTRRSRLQQFMSMLPGVKQLVGGLAKRVHGPYQVQVNRVPTLAEDTVSLYRGTVGMVEALGRAYGFRTVFYWQPIIFLKRHLSPDEVVLRNGLDYLRDLNLRVYDAVRLDRSLMNDPDFHDISGLFRDTESGVFVDSLHLSEEGNSQVARSIGQDIIPVLRALGAPHAPPARSY